MGMQVKLVLLSQHQPDVRNLAYESIVETAGYNPLQILLLTITMSPMYLQIHKNIMGDNHEKDVPVVIGITLRLADDILQGFEPDRPGGLLTRSGKL